MNSPSSTATPLCDQSSSRPLWRGWAHRFGHALVTIWALAASVATVAPTPALARALADQPLFTNTAVPGNLVLALSVEFPTVVSVAHIGADNYSSANTYLGYFDPGKCYAYVYNANELLRYFAPAGSAVNRACTGSDDSKWSGNFLNWATMQTIDPFRWALTGGYRSTDTATETILEKARASGQGGTGNFPNKSLGSTLIAGATPFSGTTFKMRIQGLGNKMRFSTGSGDAGGATSSDAYDPAAAVDGTKVYDLSVRVKVCDSSAGAGGVESNCKQYPSGNWKPIGLIQEYSDRIRYSAFGYLNDDDLKRDGGVLRARQKFVGPQVTIPGSPPQTNAASEWNASTGVYVRNPDSTDASDTATAYGVAVDDSGVVNYLNKFGQVVQGNFKTYDPVGELYYAALRYLRNKGNVSAWTSPGTANTATKTTWVDGFPVITTWDDPIEFSCQRNFVLGIGDVNTHADKNVAATGASTTNEPTKPSEVTADTEVNAVSMSNKVGTMQGIANLGTTSPYNGCCTNNSALMAGLAYDANTRDIRLDDPKKPNTVGRQTVQTYWLDVLEYSTYKKNNQFYLAAKYGGFKVPTGFDPLTRTDALPESWWHTNTDTVGSGTTAQPRPDNYFTASRPDQVVDGLTQAFANIAAALKAYTTSFSTALPQVSVSGNASFAAQFDSENWTGELVASELSFDPSTGAPSQTPAWNFSTKLAAQLTGTGWDSGRRVISFNRSTGLGVPFRSANLDSTDYGKLDTAYRAGDDKQDYLNYLRGQRLHEQGSTDTSSAKAYRTRAGLLGDVVGSKARPVGPPSLQYSDASNPGYSSFKSSASTRPTVIYVGSNGGMLHAINGALTGTDAGKELFAYVPSALFDGPTAAPGTDGLAALGNPTFVHHYYVNATPAAFDVDFGRTDGGSGTADWRTVLIGGLGKGGRSYYAIDVTNPAGMTTEALAAAKVLWEFTDSDLGYTYGEPLMIKSPRHGGKWVLVLPSGYNNSGGRGFIFIVNPRTGALIEKMTLESSVTSADGLAHLNAYLLDRTDGKADAIYAGDLSGNVWRADLTVPLPNSMPTTRIDASYAVKAIAKLTNASTQAQPVTTRPLIEVDPRSGRRYVLVGTGVMLDNTDVSSSQQQSFYAIVDGKANAFGVAADLPAGVSYPVTRAAMADNTTLTDDISFNPATQVGWYIELGTGAGSVGWRVLGDPASAFGLVSFAASLPNADVCNPSGISRIYAVNFGTGKSVLTSAGTVINYYTGIAGMVTDLRFYTVAGTPRLVVGSDTGELKVPPWNFSAAGTIRRLNWREVPIRN